jgi:hypothetical protein
MRHRTGAARELPAVDIYPTRQYSRSATKVKFYIIHLHQGTFLGSRTRRYASPEAHPGEMSLCKYILNGAQGYHPGVDGTACRTLRPTQKRKSNSLSMTAIYKLYYMEGSAIGSLGAPGRL